MAAFEIFIVVCACASVIVILFALRDTVRWRQSLGVIVLGQVIIRWVEAVAITTLTILIAVGYGRLQEFIIGWLVCLLLLLLIMVLAVIDLRQVSRARGRQQSELVQRFAADLQETLKKVKAEETPSKKQEESQSQSPDFLQ